MTKLQYLRIAMEKDASFASSIARHGGKILSGLKSFVKKPFSTTMKKVFMSRAKPGEYMKNLKSEASYGLKWGGGLAAGGIVASPAFVSRKI